MQVSKLFESKAEMKFLKVSKYNYVSSIIAFCLASIIINKSSLLVMQEGFRWCDDDDKTIRLIRLEMMCVCWDRLQRPCKRYVCIEDKLRFCIFC